MTSLAGDNANLPEMEADFCLATKGNFAVFIVETLRIVDGAGFAVAFLD